MKCCHSIITNLDKKKNQNIVRWSPWLNIWTNFLNIRKCAPFYQACKTPLNMLNVHSFVVSFLFVIYTATVLSCNVCFLLLLFQCIQFYIFALVNICATFVTLYVWFVVYVCFPCLVLVSFDYRYNLGSLDYSLLDKDRKLSWIICLNLLHIKYVWNRISLTNVMIWLSHCKSNQGNQDSSSIKRM